MAGTDMKRQPISWSSRWLGCSLLAAAFGLAASVGAARATTLSLSDTTGGTFSIAVVDANLDLTTISAIDVGITFAPAQLSFASATAGSRLPNIGLPNVLGSLFIVTPFSDHANISICCDFTGGAGDSLFSAVFDVNGIATPQITRVDFDIALEQFDQFGNLLITNLSPLSADVQITSPLSTTPLPGTGVLFLTGIAALALLGRRAMRHSPSEVSV
jgi:hypothetical protein